MKKDGPIDYERRTETCSVEIGKNGIWRTASVTIEATIGEPTRPPILYAYMKSKYALSDLVHLRLMTSEAANTNDAFEYAWKIVASNPLYSDRIPEVSKNVKSRYQREYSEILKMICFGDSSANDLLWAHYADNHAGVCIGVELGLTKEDENVIRPVRYDGPVEIDITQPRNQSTNLDLFKKVLCTKEESWKGEREWRAIIPRDHSSIHSTPDGKFYLALEPSNIKEVIFGMRCSPSMIGRIGLACMQNRISAKFLRIEPDYASHRLEPKNISKEEMHEYMTIALLDDESIRDTRSIH